VSADVRTLALVDLQIDAVRTLLAPVLGGAEIESFELADGGLVNTIYRVVVTGVHEALALRIYAAGVDAFDKERRLLQHVAPSVPVPDVLLASAGGSELPHPYIVYRWVDGMTLNECAGGCPPTHC
jgi:aminoglycoside phosphotransferase (APT) family kinase protein